MHIGLFAPALPESGISNGIITYVGIMRDALRALGHRVSVLAGQEMEDAQGRVCALPARGGWTLRAMQRLDPLGAKVGDGGGAARLAFQLAALHRRDPLDIFEVEESFGWGRKLGGRRHPPVVLRLHGPHVFGRDMSASGEQAIQDSARCLAEARALKRDFPLTCPSAKLLQATIEHHGLTPTLSAVIPNPIALPPMSEAWSIDRCDLDQILCVGRFDLRKGADIVLKAFERALIARPALRLVLVGPDKGILEPDGSLSHFATWAATNLSAGTRDRIDYRGSVSSVEVARLRRESAFSIVASRFENFAYSLAEAQAAGAPSIVSDSFGNGEIVQDGITGIVVPIADADALADAIVSLRADPERLAIMGARARERAADWLDPARVAAETADFYRRVLGNR